MRSDEGTKLLDRDRLAQLDGVHQGLILEIGLGGELGIPELATDLSRNVFAASWWEGTAGLHGDHSFGGLVLAGCTLMKPEP